MVRPRITQHDEARIGEAELITRWQAGDRRAGERLLEHHWAALDSFLRGRLGADADDARQDILLAVSRSIVGFAGTAGFKTYLFAVARNVLVTQIRRRYSQRRSGQTRAIKGDELPSNEPDQTSAVDVQRIHELLPRLSATDRRVIVLRYFHGSPYREIARELGCSENAARLRELRARERLGGML